MTQGLSAQGNKSVSGLLTPAALNVFVLWGCLVQPSTQERAKAARCVSSDVRAQACELRCGSSGVEAQVWEHRCGSTGVRAQV